MVNKEYRLDVTLGELEFLRGLTAAAYRAAYYGETDQLLEMVKPDARTYSVPNRRHAKKLNAKAWDVGPQHTESARPTKNPAAVLASVARIGAITRGVLRCAAATGATPLSVADDIVRARIIRRA
jgi:hypothetical protein